MRRPCARSVARAALIRLRCSFFRLVLSSGSTSLTGPAPFASASMAVPVPAWTVLAGRRVRSAERIVLRRAALEIRAMV